MRWLWGAILVVPGLVLGMLLLFPPSHAALACIGGKPVIAPSGSASQPPGAGSTASATASPGGPRPAPALTTTPDPVSTTSTATPTLPSQPLPTELRAAGFSHEQLELAATIAKSAEALGLDRQAMALGLMAAIRDTSLTNAPSAVPGATGTAPAGPVGVFAQPDWWGTVEQRADVATAATAFFRALQAVPGWADMKPTLAVNSVQGQVDPYRYIGTEVRAGQVLDALYRTSTVQGRCGVTNNGVLALPLETLVLTDTYGPRNAPVAGASSWHPAYDFGAACGTPVYSATAGVVVSIAGYWLTIQTPTGETVNYLHSQAYHVTPGQTVAPGQRIADVGNEGPSSGCHLDIRINTVVSTDPGILALPRIEPSGTYANPEEYYAAHGMVLCDDTCRGGLPVGAGSGNGHGEVPAPATQAPAAPASAPAPAPAPADPTPAA